MATLLRASSVQLLYQSIEINAQTKSNDFASSDRKSRLRFFQMFKTACGKALFTHRYFTGLHIGKLPDVLDILQKSDKVKNNLQTLKKQGIITPDGKTWKMSKPENNPK